MSHRMEGKLMSIGTINVGKPCLPLVRYDCNALILESLSTFDKTGA